MKPFIFFYFFLLLPAWAAAQQGGAYGAPEDRAGRMTREMEQGLPLRPEQVGPVHALNLKYARIVQREVVDTGMNKFSAYLRVQKINREKETELLPLLDAGQRERYELLKAAAIRKAWARFF